MLKSKQKGEYNIEKEKIKKPVAMNRFYEVCPEQESNLHVQNGHMALNHACLPIPTSGQKVGCKSRYSQREKKQFNPKYWKNWQGK
jgi:hypothetical protein